MFGIVAVTSKWSQVFSPLLLSSLLPLPSSLTEILIPTQFYFVFFYILTVVIVLNLIVAFIVEGYVVQFETQERSHAWKEEVRSYFLKAQVILYIYIYLYWL